MTTISPINDTFQVTTSNASADNILTPNQVVMIVTRVFTASFMTAMEFGHCDYATAAQVATEMVREAIAEAIEGRAP